MTKTIKNQTLFSHGIVKNEEEKEVIQEEITSEEKTKVIAEDIPNTVLDKFKIKEKKGKTQCSFYLDDDVVRAINKVSKGQPKGFKSELANDVFRAALKNYL